MQNKDEISKKPLTPTMGDYLEAIFNLGKEKRVVRVRIKTMKEVGGEK